MAIRVSVLEVLGSHVSPGVTATHDHHGDLLPSTPRWLATRWRAEAVDLRARALRRDPMEYAILVRAAKELDP